MPSVSHTHWGVLEPGPSGLLGTRDTAMPYLGAIQQHTIDKHIAHGKIIDAERLPDSPMLAIAWQADLIPWLG
jgi:hypothetical protein